MTVKEIRLSLHVLGFKLLRERLSLTHAFDIYNHDAASGNIITKQELVIKRPLEFETDNILISLNYMEMWDICSNDAFLRVTDEYLNGKNKHP